MVWFISKRINRPKGLETYLYPCDYISNLVETAMHVSKSADGRHDSSKLKKGARDPVVSGLFRTVERKGNEETHRRWCSSRRIHPRRQCE